MSRLFSAGLLAFLLLGAGYGVSQSARSIPWNCDDWQAFAHSDRATAILESLAENRGKTLYCGIDQSDTFAKAETWEAGREHNERDGTVYQGERGRFRGFIAAQEGWLTEGESGITGQSIATIFEFPREEKKQRKEPALKLAYDREYPNSTLRVPRITENNPNGPTSGYLIINPRIFDEPRPPGITTYIRGPRNARNGYVRAYGPAGYADFQIGKAVANARAAYRAPPAATAAAWALNGNGDTPNGLREVPGGAAEECRALGYKRATQVKWRYRDTDGNGVPDIQISLLNPGPKFQYRAFRYIIYTALCQG